MKRFAFVLLIAGFTLPTLAGAEETVNLLRDKSRHMNWSDYVVVFKCAATGSTRRYEVTADDQSEAINLARENIHQSQWCSYNEEFVSAQQAN